MILIKYERINSMITISNHAEIFPICDKKKRVNHDCWKLKKKETFLFNE